MPACAAPAARPGHQSTTDTVGAPFQHEPSPRGVGLVDASAVQPSLLDTRIRREARADSPFVVRCRDVKVGNPGAKHVYMTVARPPSARYRCRRARIAAATPPAASPHSDKERAEWARLNKRQREDPDPDAAAHRRQRCRLTAKQKLRRTMRRLNPWGPAAGIDAPERTRGDARTRRTEGHRGPRPAPDAAQRGPLRRCAAQAGLDGVVERGAAARPRGTATPRRCIRALPEHARPHPRPHAGVAWPAGAARRTTAHGASAKRRSGR